MPGEVGEDCLRPRAVGVCEGEFRSRRAASGELEAPGMRSSTVSHLAPTFSRIRRRNYDRTNANNVPAYSDAMSGVRCVAFA